MGWLFEVLDSSQSSVVMRILLDVRSTAQFFNRFRPNNEFCWKFPTSCVRPLKQMNPINMQKPTKIFSFSWKIVDFIKKKMLSRVAAT